MLERHPGGRRPLSRASDVLVMTLFVAVPLAASPRFWDQFTTVKWYVLEALALAWFVLELWRYRSAGWPAFVRGRWPARLSLLSGSLLLLGSLRAGPLWAAPALLDRACFVLLALASFWHFRRNGLNTAPMALAAGLALSLVAAFGLAQVVGGQPFPSLTAGDQRSASFGNANLAAQFVGLAVVLVLAGVGATPGRPGLARAREAAAAAGLAYLYFLSCRSAFLALAAAVVLLRVEGRLTSRALVRTAGAAALAVLLLLHLGPLIGRPPLDPFSAEVLANKALSTQMRLAVWGGTLRLVQDHPLGVGAGNFGDAFIPYQLGLPIVARRSLLFRTPHNEYLRVLAEEGLPFALLSAALLSLLVRRRPLDAPGAGGEPTRAAWALARAGAAFLAVEACFQFPLGTAFGCLTTAVLTGLGLACLEGPGGQPEGSGSPMADPRRGWRWRAGATLVAAAAAVVLGAVVASELLFVSRPLDVAAQETACALNPRNLPACVTAAWLHARGGDRGLARERLVTVLRRSPYYHPAILMLGDVADLDGDREGACLYLWIYDELFRGRSVAHERVQAVCAGRPPRERPQAARMPFYGTLPLAAKDATLR